MFCCDARFFLLLINSVRLDPKKKKTVLVYVFESTTLHTHLKSCYNHASTDVNVFYLARNCPFILGQLFN